MRRPNFTKHGKDMGRSWLRKELVSEFGYLAAFSNVSGSKLSDLRVMLKTMPNFAPLKIRGGVGEIPIPVVETTYNQASGIHLMAIRCATAECGGLIRKEEKVHG